MVELFDSWVRALGPLGYPVLGLAALIEYVFPPFPGDTITLLGGAYAARGDRSVPLVLLAVTLGSMVGMIAMWAVGHAVGDRVDRLPDGKLAFGISHAQIRRAQDLMRDKGVWLLLGNRFLPSFRAVLFVAAGASHLPLRRVLFLGTISALLWNTLLVLVGDAVGTNVERIERFFLTYRLVALAVVAIVAILLLGRFFWRRRQAQSGLPPGAKHGPDSGSQGRPA